MVPIFGAARKPAALVAGRLQSRPHLAFLGHERRCWPLATIVNVRPGPLSQGEDRKQRMAAKRPSRPGPRRYAAILIPAAAQAFVPIYDSRPTHSSRQGAARPTPRDILFYAVA